MILFADYEGLGVAFGEVLWFLATLPALVCGLGGTVAGALRIPRPRLAFWLGIVACCLELPAIALVQIAFLDEQSRHGAYAERFRPGVIFWSASMLTTVLGVLAIGLGIARRAPSPGNQATNPRS